MFLKPNNLKNMLKEKQEEVVIEVMAQHPK
jgi:hypothetical protein